MKERWVVIYDLMKLDINQHQRYWHICSICYKKYKTESGLYRHIDNIHNEEINKIRHEQII